MKIYNKINHKIHGFSINFLTVALSLKSKPFLAEVAKTGNFIPHFASKALSV